MRRSRKSSNRWSLRAIRATRTDPGERSDGGNPLADDATQPNQREGDCARFRRGGDGEAPIRVVRAVSHGGVDIDGWETVAAGHERKFSGGLDELRIELTTVPGGPGVGRGDAGARSQQGKCRRPSRQSGGAWRGAVWRIGRRVCGGRQIISVSVPGNREIREWG